MQTSTMKACFQIVECSFSSVKKMQTSTMKAAFKLPSAAFLLQIYEIFLFSLKSATIIQYTIKGRFMSR